MYAKIASHFPCYEVIYENRVLDNFPLASQFNIATSLISKHEVWIRMGWKLLWESKLNSIQNSLMLLLSYKKQYSIQRNKGEILLINKNLKVYIDWTVIKNIIKSLTRQDI